ncbi:hypothetical protein F2Q69_00044730 [Brassica cretica]|uniref:Uncharacterized protein n=1 Tax=Brassica cretica TaxID=69181 RepID=A0A8S9NGG9_BRACR|nr:hypothetical protein F2Q69_00044730 [Brassica cretica]
MVLSPHANSGSIVKYLPGFEEQLFVHQRYIRVGEEEQVQLFYYFIKSERNTKEDPLLLWLTGCSAVSALLFENGPVKFRVEGYNGGTPTLLSTTYSWTQIASIIYLDQPVGTGFSYSKTQLLDTPSDSGEAKRIHEFLLKWLAKHEKFISNPFYVTGNSYAGKVIPATVQEISKGNDLGFKPQINLQSLKKTCNGNYEKVDPGNIECLQFVKNTTSYLQCIAGIYLGHVLAPICAVAAPGLLWPKHVPKRDLRETLPPNLSVSFPNCIVNNPSPCSFGDHDMTIPFTATQTWIWMIHNQVAGPTKTYANKMIFATVKGGGHTSKFKPEESFIMFRSSLPGFEGPLPFELETGRASAVVYYFIKSEKNPKEDPLLLWLNIKNC